MFINSNSIQLSAEQKARIEENRKQALDRQKARNSRILQNNSGNSPKILPSKGNSSINRVNPYLIPPLNKFPNQLSNSNTVKKIVSHPLPQRAVKCLIEMLSEDRFSVKTNIYDDRIIQEFKKIPSKIYNGTTRNWSFNFTDYNQLISSLVELKNVEIIRIPDFVLKCMTEKTISVNESCLDQIEETIASTLLDFQRQGICFGISKKGRCMIADDMGLGKSRQAIGIADFYRNDWPLLIITNASTRHFWAKEIENLLPSLTFNDIHIIQSSNDYFEQAKVVICSYNSLQGSVDELMRMKFGVIIFDESHNIKNPKAKQTINAENLSKKASRIIMLTGTPALSRPVELYPQLKILDPKFATYPQFTTRYCNGMQTNFGWNANGSSNLEELNIVLKKKFLIRRIKSDVFVELRAKDRELVQLNNYEHQSALDEEMQEFKSQYHNAMNKNTSDQILLQWFQSTSQIKTYAVCTFVNKYLEDHDEKILVFANHIFMMNALCAELEKADIDHIRIDGSVKGELRNSRVENFQNNPHIRAAVLSIRACNAGITLTAAKTVIFGELDWNPSTIVQAEARAHRIGQENTVKVYFLFASKTADDVIWDLLQQKQNKLGKAGLVANIENFSTSIPTSNFDVKEKKFTKKNGQLVIKVQENENKCQDNQKTEKMNQSAVNYFEDDIDDEEFLKMVENLP